jgi:hypothetical protein
MAASIPTLKIDGTPERVQLAAMQRLRAQRDAGAARAGLDGVQRASEGDGNLMEAVLAEV